MTQQPINYAKYSDSELEECLSSIDRSQYEYNLIACKAEIDRRKAAGQWHADAAVTQATKVRDFRQIVKGFAILQFVGSFYGIYIMTMFFISAMNSVRLNGLEMLMTLSGIAAFFLLAWATWNYWVTGRDRGHLWRTLLLFQIPGFRIGGLAYEFYSGLRLPIGVANGHLSIGINLGSNLTLFYYPQGAPFLLLVNLVPIAILTMLHEVS